MSFQIEDIAYLMQVAAGVVSHPALTNDTVKEAQRAVKAFLIGKEALQDPEILMPFDKILKYGGAAQVPGAFVPASFDPNDYAVPNSPAAQPEQLPPPEEPAPDSVLPVHPAVEEPTEEYAESDGSLSQESDG